jgi:hypothetical protein
VFFSRLISPAERLLGRGVIDSPQTITAETRGKRKGYTCCLLSLELLIPSQNFCLLPYCTANASSRDHGGADKVICRCGVPGGIPGWRRPPAIRCHATPISLAKVVCLLNQIAFPLILYGLEVGLHCAALPPWQHHPRLWGFLPVVSESLSVVACRRRARLSLHSPLVLSGRIVRRA